MLWIPDFRNWITDFLTMELGLQIPIASGIPDSTSKNFPDSENRITFHLAYTEKNRAQCESFNPGQKSSGQYCNIHIFLSFLGSLLKKCIFCEIFLQFSLPPPYTKLKLGSEKFWIHASNIVCRVRGGFGPVWIGKHHRNAKVSQDFCPWL